MSRFLSRNGPFNRLFPGRLGGAVLGEKIKRSCLNIQIRNGCAFESSGNLHHALHGSLRPRKVPLDPLLELAMFNTFLDFQKVEAPGADVTMTNPDVFY